MANHLNSIVQEVGADGGSPRFCINLCVCARDNDGRGANHCAKAHAHTNRPRRRDEGFSVVNQFNVNDLGESCPEELAADVLYI